MARASIKPAPSALAITHLAVAHRLHQTGDAEPRTGVEFERVGEIGVDAAQQHFGAAQSGYCTDEDAIVAHDQVLALDQQQAEIAREIGVLEIGFVHRPGRQQTDARVVLPVIFEQLGLKRLEERRDAFDVGFAIDVGDGARQRQPVLDRVARAGGRLCTIAEHPPFPVRPAPDFHGDEAQMRAARRCDAGQRAQEFRIAGDQRRRQTSVA